MAFGVVHSALASLKAKEAAGATFRHGAEWYRVAYNAQSVITFGALAWYIATRPKRTLYHVRGPAAAAMRLAQAGGVIFAIAAARATGVLRLTGLDNAIALARGTHPHPVPIAQGPELDELGGHLRIEGPFRLARHPLNLAPLAPFWFTPHLTSRRLAFNLVATAYLVIGSCHEERRLARVYGEQYEAYRRSGVPFYSPRLTRRPARAVVEAH